MFTKLAKFLSPSIRQKQGFTLIELLIVVAIIAILAAIAIPQFSAYRKRGYNAAANSDLRNIRTTEEAIYADFSEYGTSTATLGAVGAQMTGTLSLSGAKTTTITQTISMSPNVFATVISTQNTLGTARPDYAAVTANSVGDNFYGANSTTTTLYRKGFATWVVGTTDTANAGGVTATATASASAFDSTWTALQ